MVYDPNYKPTGPNNRSNEYYKKINHVRIARNMASRSEFYGSSISVAPGGVAPSAFAYTEGMRLDAHPDFAALTNPANWQTDIEGKIIVQAFFLVDGSAQADSYLVQTGEAITLFVADDDTPVANIYEYTIDASVNAFILQQPQPANTIEGDTANFSVYAPTAEVYMWEYSTDGTVWKQGFNSNLQPDYPDWTGTASDASVGDTWEITEVHADMDTMLVRCYLNGGAFITSEVALSVTDVLEQPVVVTPAAAAGSAVESLTLTGTPATFSGGMVTVANLWEVSNTGAGGWASTGNTTTTSPEQVAGKYYRFVSTATNAVGSATSNSNVIGPAAILQITATLSPATSALVVGQALGDTTNWNAFLDLANYSSNGGTISSVVVNYIGSTPDANTAFADGQTNHFSITVTDSIGTVRTFDTASRTVVYAAPLASSLSPVNETQGNGTPIVVLSEGFTGENLEYASNQAWAVVSGNLLTIADEVRTGTVRITATNSGGSAFVDLSVTIAAPVVTVPNPIADQTFFQDTGDFTVDLRTVFANATSYSVSGPSASIDGDGYTLRVDDGTLRAGVTITVTGSNAYNSADDVFLLTIEAFVGMTVETVDFEPVINAVDGLVSVTIESGTYAGTYSERITDGAPLTVAMIQAAPTPVVRPDITGSAVEDETLEVTPGLWLFEGEDPGDQKWEWINNTSGPTGDVDLDYVVRTSDIGHTLKVTESFAGLTLDSLNTATVAAGTPPFPDPFVDANWSVATGGTGTPNSLLITIASLPADNGGTITDIQYDVGENNVWTSLGITTATIQMPAPQTSYSIRLRAVNVGGAAEAGNTETATSGAGVPSVVTDFIAATGAGLSEVDIRINTLPNPNGSTITDFEYDVDANDVWTSLGISTATTQTVIMEAPGISYTIRVRARNAVGVGVESAPDEVESGGGIIDPEAGLILTNTYPATATITSVIKTEDAVFACDFAGLTSAQGAIFEEGLTSTGSAVYINSSGQLIIQAGGAAALVPYSDAAYLIVPAPTGDGTLVWEVTIGVNTVRAWWNGRELGTPVARAVGSGDWAGSNSGSYLKNGVATSAPVGYPNNAISPVTASTLRYYRNQTVTWKKN